MNIKGSFGKYRFFLDRVKLAGYTNRVGNNAKEVFIKGMLSKKTGRVYSGIRASAPGEYPAIRTGRLYNSITVQSNADRVTIGTLASYGRFLAYGTKFIEPRSMSKQALRSGILSTRFSFPLSIKKVVNEYI